MAIFRKSFQRVSESGASQRTITIEQDMHPDYKYVVLMRTETIPKSKPGKPAVSVEAQNEQFGFNDLQGATACADQKLSDTLGYGYTLIPQAGKPAN
jgi:hypothetical protein